MQLLNLITMESIMNASCPITSVKVDDKFSFVFYTNADSNGVLFVLADLIKHDYSVPQKINNINSPYLACATHTNELVVLFLVDPTENYQVYVQYVHFNDESEPNEFRFTDPRKIGDLYAQDLKAFNISKNEVALIGKRYPTHARRTNWFLHRHIRGKKSWVERSMTGLWCDDLYKHTIPHDIGMHAEEVDIIKLNTASQMPAYNLLLTASDGVALDTRLVKLLGWENHSISPIHYSSIKQGVMNLAHLQIDENVVLRVYYDPFTNGTKAEYIAVNTDTETIKKYFRSHIGDMRIRKPELVRISDENVILLYLAKEENGTFLYSQCLKIGNTRDRKNISVHKCYTLHGDMSKIKIESRRYVVLHSDHTGVCVGTTNKDGGFEYICIIYV